MVFVIASSGVMGKLTIRPAFDPASLQPATSYRAQPTEPGRCQGADGGHVVGVSTPSSPKGALVRRTADLRLGDYLMNVNILGAPLEQAPPLHGKIAVFSCKVSTWMNIPVLET